MQHTSFRRVHKRHAFGVWSLTAAFALAAPHIAQSQASPSADTPSDMSRMIGLSVAASGGPRDTLGLLIATVTRDGPADRAGITTGSRILAVNGLQVRLAPADIGRRAAADSALLKFDRALRVTPPGRDVMLRVAGGGLTRLVNVPVVDRRAEAIPASIAVRTPSAMATPDAAAPSDTNGERATTAVAAGAYSPPANQAPPPRPVYTVDPVVTTPAPAATIATVAAQPVKEPRSVSTLADALGDMQLELRRLAHDSHSLAMSDSLADLDAAVGALRRRMRTITPEALPAVARTDSVPARATAAPQPTTPAVVVPAVAAPVTVPSVGITRASAIPVSTRISVAGLELAKVSAELAAYLGAQAESGLSVVRATDAWEPMHAGDVIVQVDGAAPDPERLRTALESHKRISVTLLRRGRSFTVLLGDADGR
jgi:S1-C subfamily serine protease